MRKKQQYSLGEAIQQFLDKSHLNEGLLLAQIQDIWRLEMSKPIVNRTISIDLKDKTLYVKLNSSVLRKEMEFEKDNIIQLINSKYDQPVLDTISFTV